MKRSSQQRAVSEAISYVLIFGLMVLGTAAITLQAGPALDAVQQDAINQNSKESMSLIQSRFDEAVREEAPLRKIPLETQEVTAGIGGIGDTRVNITVTNGLGTSVYESNISPVHIQTDSRTFVYENDALMSGTEGVSESWAMYDSPSWAVSANNSSGKVSSAFIRTIATSGGGGVTGQGGATLVLESVGNTNENLRGVTNMNITVTSPRSEAWGDYLSRLNSSLNGTRYIKGTSAPSLNDRQVRLHVEDLDDGSISYSEAVIQARLE
jgi:hypothetical protein